MSRQNFTVFEEYDLESQLKYAESTVSYSYVIFCNDGNYKKESGITRANYWLFKKSNAVLN